MPFGSLMIFLRLKLPFVRMIFSINQLILAKISGELVSFCVLSVCWSPSYRTTRRFPNGIHMLVLACLLGSVLSILFWFHWFSICALGDFASVSCNFWQHVWHCSVSSFGWKSGQEIAWTVQTRKEILPRWWVWYEKRFEKLASPQFGTRLAPSGWCGWTNSN